MRFRQTVLLLAAMSLPVAPAAAGVIQGTVWLRSPTPVAAGKSAAATPASAGKNATAAPAAQPQKGVTDAVVYVEAVPPRAEQALTRTGFLFFRRKVQPRVFTIVQSNRQFRPRVLAIPAGTQVAFQNLDRFYHSTFSVSRAKPFDLGKYPPGQRDTVLFDKAGVVNLHCDIHPDMEGFVVVTPNHAMTVPDSLGHYHLPSLPPGTYTVRVFHPRLGEIRRTAEIPKRGNLELDLKF